MFCSVPKPHHPAYTSRLRRRWIFASPVTVRIDWALDGNPRMEHTKISFSNALRGFIFALVLTLATASVFAQASDRPSDVLGMAVVGHQVSDLERSIKFFETIDFKVAEGPGAWTVDKELNKLGNTPGAESRTAIMKVQSSVSDVPFTLVLRQYRGIQRQDWSKLNSWDLSANHIDMTVDGSVSTLLDKLEGLNMLKMPEIQGLPNPRQQQGFRRYAFISDPDGLTIENFGKPIPKPGDPPARPTVSNSSATAAKHRPPGQTDRLQSLRRKCHRSPEGPGFLCEGPGRRLSARGRSQRKADHAKRLVPAGDDPRATCALSWSILP